MRRPLMHTILVLLFCAISSACASNNPRSEPQIIRLPPEIRTRYEYPEIPAEVLSCLAEPIAPNARTDVEFALWAQAVREAGSDCRAKLDAIRDLAAMWHK